MTEVIDDDIRGGNEPMQHLLPRRATEIEDDRVLITIEGGEIPAQPFNNLPLRAQGVTRRRLDLDDLSPHVCQQHCTEGAGENTGQINHTDALQMHRSHTSYRGLLPAQYSM